MWSPGTGGGGDGMAGVSTLGSMGLKLWMNASTVRLEQKTPGPINRIDD